MAKVTFDGPNLLIVVDAGVTQLSVNIDLYSAWKEWVRLSDNSKFMPAFRAIGGDPLPGGLTFGSGIFLQNQVGWRIRPQEASHELMVVGNLYPESGALPMFVSTLGPYTVSVMIERSAQTQVILQNTGSAMTEAEHNRLMALPTETLASDERAHLLAVPTTPGGMSQAEHDRLMSLPTTTLESDERTKLLVLPAQAGLTQAEHDQLMALPLTDIGLTAEEHSQLMAIPSLTAAAARDATLGDVIAELTSAPSATPTLRQAIAFLFMALRNRTITTETLLRVHNAAGDVIAEAPLSTIPGVSFTRDSMRGPA